MHGESKDQAAGGGGTLIVGSCGRWTDRKIHGDVFLLYLVALEDGPNGGLGGHGSQSFSDHEANRIRYHF
jgi:hypothetical protein